MKVYKIHLKWNATNLIHNFLSLSFDSSCSRPNQKNGLFLKHECREPREARVGFSWWKPQVLAHYESCEGGREVHPWAGIRRTRLGAPFSQLKTEKFKKWTAAVGAPRQWAFGFDSSSNRLNRSMWVFRYLRWCIHTLFSCLVWSWDLDTIPTLVL